MSSRVLSNPSDLFFAIGDTLIATIPGIDVGNYDEFEGALSDATVLIEFERSSPATRDNTGRYAHDYAITLHATVALWRKYAPLEAINLCGVIERVADTNCWGLPPDQIDMPRDMHASPSIFQKGNRGYEAWGVTFHQTIYLGESWALEDPVTVAGPQIANAWQVDTTDPYQYQPLIE